MMQIGAWSVYPYENAIRQAACEIRISPRSMDVLVYLGEHASRTISADELLDGVWGDVIVEPQSVRKAISELRGALGHEAIRTIRKRGYRLVAPVITSANRSSAAVESTVVAPPRGAIAIMPFENLSPDPNHAFFAAGVHEELLNQLAKIAGLSVIARSTMKRYADTRLSTREIAAELNVQTVMEGSVRYAGSRVRIMAQLIDAESGIHLWSEAYEQDLEDVFRVQLAIATRIACSLDVEFSLSQQQRMGRKPTENPDAYRVYLQALSRWGNLAAPAPVHESLDTAMMMDPEFAAPVALKAWMRSIEALYYDVYGVEAFSAADQEALISEAELLGHRALALNDGEVLALLALSTVYLHYHRWEAAEEVFARIPTDTSLYVALGHVACAASRCWGDIDLAIRLVDRSIALSPADGAIVWNAGVILYWAQQWRAAERHAQRAVQLLPDASLGYAWHALASSRVRDREAVYHYGKLAEARRPRLTDLATIARAYGQIGDVQEARRVFNSTGAGARANNQIPEWQFWIHMAVEDYETAMCYLETAVTTNFPQILILDLHYASAHPDFDPIRSHPKFDELVARAASPIRRTTPR